MFTLKTGKLESCSLIREFKRKKYTYKELD